MAREVQFDDENVILKLSGVNAISALKLNLKMPFETIKSVYVDSFDAPRWMLRMPGTSISALNIFEGSFKYANKWYFLSYEKKVSLVIIELDGHERYDYVIFEIDKPTNIAFEIRKHLLASD